jgi:hypothetical protein
MVPDRGSECCKCVEVLLEWTTVEIKRPNMLDPLQYCKDDTIDKQGSRDCPLSSLSRLHTQASPNTAASDSRGRVETIACRFYLSGLGSF